MAKIYNTIASPCEFTYEEKRSKFITFLYPVSNKDRGFEHLEELKTLYPDARHHCWAYLLGNPEQALSAGFNDDGEPGGTAGKPMLNVLTKRKVGDVFAVVVRYFGGIKLGAGGLTRAYGQAVSGALDSATLLEVVPMEELVVFADYALEARLRNILEQRGITRIKVDYSEEVELKCVCPSHLVDDLILQVSEATGGQVRTKNRDLNLT